ncbi:MAG: hypothetical protein ACYTFY_03520 [Planctomycetota bacterium]|jgi:hypothetical protein
MNIFLAGIIQGSLPDSIESQDYREPILSALGKVFPEADIYDPIAEFPDSLEFTDKKSEEVFFHLMQRAGESDLLVAYVPSASMGTAIEIWNAFKSKKPVVVISPLELNWVIRFCADKICGSIEDFIEFAESGALERLCPEK